MESDFELHLYMTQFTEEFFNNNDTLFSDAFSFSVRNDEIDSNFLQPDGLSQISDINYPPLFPNSPLTRTIRVRRHRKKIKVLKKRKYLNTLTSKQTTSSDVESIRSQDNKNWRTSKMRKRRRKNLNRLCLSCKLHKLPINLDDDSFESDVPATLRLLQYKLQPEATIKNEVINENEEIYDASVECTATEVTLDEGYCQKTSEEILPSQTETSNTEINESLSLQNTHKIDNTTINSQDVITSIFSQNIDTNPTLSALENFGYSDLTELSIPRESTISPDLFAGMTQNDDVIEQITASLSRELSIANVADTDREDDGVNRSVVHETESYIDFDFNFNDKSIEPERDDVTSEDEEINPIDCCSMYFNSNSQFLSTEEVNERSKGIMEQLQDMIKYFLIYLSQKVNPAYCIRSRGKNSVNFNNDILSLKTDDEADVQILYLFRSNGTLNNRFVVLLHLAVDAYKLLSTKKSCTLRELYYNNTILYKSTSCLQHTLIDLSCLLNVSPWELGIYSTSKGLVSGNIQFKMENDSIVDCSQFETNLIPHNILNVKDIVTAAEIVLIVEKDTVFKRLLREDIMNNFFRKLIMITGKGYPDINTRILVRKIWELYKLPIYILVDGNPHGIEIMCTYRFGSVSLSVCGDSLAVPEIRWLGIHPCEMLFLATKMKPLSSRDYKKIDSLLNRFSSYPKLCNELNLLKEMSVKAEIENIATLDSRFLLDGYIWTKIGNNILI